MDQQHHSNDNPTVFRGCPSFGLNTDAETKVLFPSPRGACHAVKSPTPVDAEYQKIYCLQGEHKMCPIYMQAYGHGNGVEPTSAESPLIGADIHPKRRNPMRMLGMLAIVLLLVAAAFGLLRDEVTTVFAQVSNPSTVYTAPIPTRAISDDAPVMVEGDPAPTLPLTAESAAISAEIEPTATPAPTIEATAEPTAQPTAEASDDAKRDTVTEPAPSPTPAEAQIADDGEEPDAEPTSVALPTRAPTAEPPPSLP